MVATFSWYEYIAAADSAVPTNINMGSTIARNLTPSTWPVTAGENSFEKYAVGRWSGSFTNVDNLQFWMSGSGSGYVTDETINVNATTSSYSAASFVTPTTDASGEAVHLIPTADPAAANVGISGSLAGDLTATGDSDYIVLQLQIGASAPAGAVQQKTFTLQYDEI